MRKLLTGALLALTAFTFVSTSYSTDAEARHGRRRALAAGLAIGLTAAVIANSANASERRRWRRQCERWAYRCDMGSVNACYKYDANCT